MGGWSCPHEVNGYCEKRKLPCEPGAKGCVLNKKNLIWIKPEKTKKNKPTTTN